MPISRMQQPRQLYGLGSLVKSVGKAVKGAVKGAADVAKSDLGKTALTAAALYYGGRMIPGIGEGTGGISSFFGKGSFNPLKMLQTVGPQTGQLVSSPFAKFLKSGIGSTAAMFAAGSLLPSVLGEAEETGDVENITRNVPALKTKLTQAYKLQRTFADSENEDAAIAEQVERDVSEYTAGQGAYAVGGRVGYDNGGYTFEQFMNDKFQVDQFMGEEQMKKLYEKMMREKKVREQKTMAAEGGRIGFKDGTDENLVGIETLKLGDYDLEGFQKKGRGNTLMFGSDDLKMLSQSLDYGELSNLSNRQKEKIKESILRARAGIINPTELMNEIGMLRLEPDAAAFLKKIIPDETMEKVFFDKEGDARIGVQKANKLLEDVAFGGQKNPTLSSDMYNKLGDEYIKDQKKAIQREIDFNKKYGEANFLNFKDGGRIGYARGTDDIVDQASGIMGLPQRINKAGVKELDLRESGGFIPPVGVKEKADDIPAMLSNNEFVFTADAVRGMGGGDVNKGAQRLYDQMKMLEKGGRV